ncbi:hypothetical protein [Pelomonas cellulosilytica]|uniref:DUF3604 domain-containing protein n=1 Tax=Pelomonas cellulosilytica TaxID=2906762 RepID=A0ABS8XR10_9BURK|nr:hypothetical protein [Pelomonas sp. P8]MCE4555169.1 hypothetical protein [Pelomonas sp. P8]
MTHILTKSQIALAAVAALGSAAVIAPNFATAAGKTPGKYVSGDFHNHTTCSDGSISMQKLVKKVTDKNDTPWGLDWFVQAGHGGNGNRNCTLTEDPALQADQDLSTPAYPTIPGKGPTTTWANSIGAANLKGDGGGVGGTGNMWRWQSLQEYQYPVIEYLAAKKNLPLFIGLESVVAGHEHTSMSVITGQMPASVDTATLPTTPGYTALGNATALAQWSYCFDRGDTDTSRGNTTGTTTGNNWNCANPASADSTSATLGWNDAAKKLLPAGGTGTGERGHLKTVEALKWMANFHGQQSYYVPAHLERAGPFNPNGNNGFNIEHLRNFNNAAPNIAFGFESQPGHGAANNRGEYQVKRNNFAGFGLVDSVGGTTYGGTGVYAGQIGGVWDALLGEGRNWWFFASSDWHNRGQFGPDDRRSSQDFYPGEYQRTHVLVRNGADKLRPQTIVDGLRTGNAWSATGQLIDRLAFVACTSYAGVGARTNASVEAIALAAATNATDIDKAGCATMGEKLTARPGADIVVAVVLRDPAGTNYSPYSFPNPSLAQIGITQPINKPVLDHVDVIGGKVTGYRTPGTAGYAGEWPRNTDWLKTDGTTTGLANVPDAAKNLSAAILKTFSGNGASAWTAVQSGVDNTTFLKMSFRIPAVQASQYVRLRGSNLPAAVPYETDASGNPLSDIYTNANDPSMLRIPCNTVGTNVPATGATWTQDKGTIDGCPSHLATVNGQKYVSYDVAAWSDLWFYSNPIYVEVANSFTVAGVK